MYYEEKIIDGILMCRNMPRGEWKPKGGSVAIVVNQLMLMSESDRQDVFSFFCSKCGTDDIPCHCWNDE